MAEEQRDEKHLTVEQVDAIRKDTYKLFIANSITYYGLISIESIKFYVESGRTRYMQDYDEKGMAEGLKYLLNEHIVEELDIDSFEKREDVIIEELERELIEGHHSPVYQLTMNRKQFSIEYNKIIDGFASREVKEAVELLVGMY